MHGHIRHLPLDPQVPHSHVAVLWHAGAGTPMHTQATLGSEPHRQQHNTQRLHQLREYVLPMAVGVAGGGDGGRACTTHLRSTEKHVVLIIRVAADGCDVPLVAPQLVQGGAGLQVPRDGQAVATTRDLPMSANHRQGAGERETHTHMTGPRKACYA